MEGTRRVLITGVSRFWGCQLAKRLERDASIERLVAIDTAPPPIELTRTDFVRADIRHSLIGKLLHAIDIDTVVHAGLIVDPRRAGARQVHETNVIGTMNLIAACSARDAPVRKLVVKSSTAVYGAEAEDPSLWSEEMVRRAPARDSFTRDLDEVEGYVRDFSLRKPDAVTTVLRFANVLGPTHDTPFSRLFDLPAVPTVIGFDPRLQFLHESDAVDVLEHAVLHDRPGIYNVAGGGVVILSQAIAMMGKRNLPLLPFVGGGGVMSVVNRVVPLGFPAHLTRLLQFGRVVDTSALHERYGLLPRHTTAQTVLEHAQGRRVRDRIRDQRRAQRSHAELEDLLRATQPAATNGHRASRVGRSSSRPARRAGNGRRRPS
jgi:UDP-glucose 4-epimerase